MQPPRALPKQQERRGTVLSPDGAGGRVGEYSWRVLVYLGLVTASLVPVTALAVQDLVQAGTAPWTPSTVLVVVLLALALVAGELRPVSLSRGEEITVASTFGVALLLVAPVLLAVVAQTVALVLDQAVRGRSWSRLPFNTAQYALSLVAARAVYAQVSGEPFTPLPGADPDLPGAAAAGLVFLVLNNGSVALAVSLHLRVPLRRVVTDGFRLQLLTAVPLVGLAPVVAHTALWSPAAVLLLVLPIGALHHGLRAAVQRQAEALRDPLTGLANRAALSVATERALQGDAPTALLLLDLDHFHDVNDTLGHAVGDQLLQAVGTRLQALAGPADLVARLGGDEFVLLSGAGTDAEQLAGRVDAALRAPYEVQGVRLAVGCSIGIALAPQHADTVEGLLRCADVALYAAKATRGTHAVYDVQDDHHSAARLGLQADLRAALEDPDDTTVTVALQPQLDLRTGRVGSVEALVRWAHPVLGNVPPDAFIPVAESTSLIDALLHRVLHLSLAELRRWDADGLTVDLAVNLSARQLTDEGLPEAVLAALASHGLPPSRLVLEVTESRLMSDPERSARILRRLQDAGIAISVDDFGTGHSSLAYLQRLAVDELKIDKSFTLRLAEPGNAAIVRSTIRLGHDLGLRVVAEGVEDQAAADALRAMGCDLLQGYHVGRPAPPEQVRAQLLGVRVPEPRRGGTRARVG